MKLNRKVAVITGGSSGIGFGIAKDFLKEGAVGVIHGRDKEKLARAQKELGESFTAINGDVTKPVKANISGLAWRFDDRGESSPAYRQQDNKLLHSRSRH